MEVGELLPEAWVSAEQALGPTRLRIDSWSLENMENAFAGSSGKVGGHCLQDSHFGEGSVT